ncbi:hypothetical protein ABTK82_19695, partial [Acinetobacter baumannii]
MDAVLHTVAIRRGRWRGAAVAAALLLGACSPHGSSTVADAAVDKNGNLHVPANYRTTYAALGTFAVAADQGPGAKQLHIVYTQP